MTIIFRGYRSTGYAPKGKYIKSAPHETRRAKNGRMIEIREYWEEIPDELTFPSDKLAKDKIYQVESMLKLIDFFNL